ncbi:ferrous iron transport protein A [Putridiphycobacter roseus]|uniref:Ferrous iron transport protein A n=1 Tax=Putridiphycobacter roseus TaxID=2219161 RepID=A0A2W1NL96_9FLAO|nr:FeoA family protein [Putridiphycobacter roseus]PZE16432.1 ferrous iron transport protein A [Putridiphycobacter roseus]
MNIRLTKLKQRVAAKITAIESEEVLARLVELGIMPGVFLSVQNKAPFNGPLAVLVNGTKIIIRKKDAYFILLEA